MNFITDKGFAGEHFVIADLTLRGFVVLQPILPNTPFDLVVLRGSTSFNKVQVKTGTFDEEGKMFIYLRKRDNTAYTDRDYDVLAVFETSTKEVAYLPYSIKKKITFTRSDTRGTTSLKMEDFTEFPLE